MIEVKEFPSYRRPYADEEIKYEITAEGMTEEEVKQYCTEKVHRAFKAETDDRYWHETYYKFCKIGENKYLYTVVVPNCE